MYVALISIASLSLVTWAFCDFNLNMGRLAFLGALIGFLIGAPLSGQLFLRAKGLQAISDRRRYEMRILITGLFINIMPLLAQKLNTEFGAGEVSCNRCMVLEKSKKSSRRAGRTSITIFRNAERQKVQAEPDLYRRTEPGDTVEVCIREGSLSFDHITAVTNRSRIQHP